MDGYEGKLLSVRGSRVKRILVELSTYLVAAGAENLKEAIDSSSTYQQLSLTGFPSSYTVTDINSYAIQLPAYTGSFSTKNLTAVSEEEEV